QPGLESFQAETLEDALVGADRAAPFVVVITEILGGAERPGAAQPPVRAGFRRAAHVTHRGWRLRHSSRLVAGPSAAPAAACSRGPAGSSAPPGSPAPAAGAWSGCGRAAPGSAALAAPGPQALAAPGSRALAGRVLAAPGSRALAGRAAPGARPDPHPARSSAVGDGWLPLAERRSASCWRSTAISTSRSVTTWAIRLKASSVT